MPERGLGERVAAVIVAGYPRRFRERLGADLLATCRRGAREARREGRLAVARFWARTLTRSLVDLALERGAAVADGARARQRRRPAGWLDGARQDARLATRRLLRSPGFAALAAGTFALGIGAATAIFSIADAVVFKPLPYAAAERLFVVNPSYGDLELGSQSAPLIRDVAAAVSSFASVVGASDDSPALTGDGAPLRVTGMTVTEGYFGVFGAGAALGRTFGARDHAAGAARVAVISDGLWQRRFGGDPGALGRDLAVDGEPHVVVGVMPRDYRDPEELAGFAPPALWLPLRADAPAYGARESFGFRTVVRLADGATAEQARAELAALAAQLGTTDAHAAVAGRAFAFDLVPLRDLLVGDARGKVYLLLGAVALLLLVACANVGNLFLVRGAARRTELDLRSALGARPARLLQQLLAEAAVVALCGGALGIGLAHGGIDLFQTLGPERVPRLSGAALDLRALSVALAVATVSALAFAAAPLLDRGGDAAAALRAGGRATEARRSRRLRSGLVVVEVAVALVLLASAALLVHSFVRATRVDPGFEADGVIALEVRPPPGSEDFGAAFYSLLVERVGALPGVEAAALIQTAPAVPGGTWTRYLIEQRPEVWDEARFDRQNAITPGAFDVLGVRLVAGRPFDARDSAGAPVAIVNDVAARRFWGGASPIGSRIKQGGPESEAPWVAVVGVVAGVHQRSPQHDVEPEFFFPYGHETPPRMTLVARVAGAAGPSADTLRRVVWEVDADTPIDRLLSMRERVDVALAEPRFYAALLGSFGALALLLAVVGVYGNVAYSVSRDAKEMAVRIALGARSAQVVALAVGRGVKLLAAGLLLGSLGSLALGRSLESLLFRVSPTDPATLAAPGAVLALSGLLACWIPARRCTRLDPNQVLRAE